MRKQCPHCKEYSFGLRELIYLDYFSVQSCPNCDKLVRNDGLRQVLIIPAVMGALVIGYLILVLLPEPMLPLSLVLAVAIVALAIVTLAKPVKADYREINVLPFNADPDNDKAIVVEGWDEEQLRVIIEGFIAKGDAEGPPYEIELQHQVNDDYRLTFPRDIHPSEFAALVNYLRYPIEYGIPAYAITALGRMTLDAVFDGIPEHLIGKRALVYIPENDEDHDIVYVQTESAATYSYSFPDSSWRQVQAARLSNDVNRLRDRL